ncbi:deoxyribose-phosphate aldolase [Clostridia bacterium]|nr:deoxyribose-phosphate aldolase [Clostridia bacterium]
MLLSDKRYLPMIDHTLLTQTATPEQIKKLCKEAAKYGFASVCVPPSYVVTAVEELKALGSGVGVCSVAGFALGYNTTQSKVFEAKQAIEQGAAEVDMVINVGRLLSDDNDYVLNEIKLLKEAVGGKALKVIVETCLLDEARKITACELVTQAGADFIKTSTGFAGGGATIEDVRLMRAHVGKGVKVKAAGGIRTAELARALAEAGADRLGMSAAIGAFALD